MTTSAVISSCGRYRYRLDRTLDFFGRPSVAFCLHNPSTADETNDDPTSRRAISFAKAWGASKLILVNPWAGRATKPRDLWTMEDPVGPENDQHLSLVASEIRRTGGFLVMAHGRVLPPARLQGVCQARLEAVEALFRNAFCDLRAIGLNADGSPKHPLYVSREAKPVSFVNI